MIQYSYFPKGCGMYYSAAVTDDNGNVKIDPFNFSLNGKTYAIAGATFSMQKGDIIYITTNGLKLCKGETDASPVEYPDSGSMFPNNSVHWLVSCTDDNTYNVLEVQ